MHLYQQKQLCSSLRQLLLNGLSNLAQRDPWVEELYVRARWIRQNLREVPGNLLIAPAACVVQRAVVAQVAKDCVRVATVHVALGEHGESSVVALSRELLYLCVRAWFLPSKLVAGEGKDLETLLSILLVEIRQLSVVVRRQASLRRYVHEHDDLFL